MLAVIAKIPGSPGKAAVLQAVAEICAQPGTST
jgi:hypothetical protein